MSARSVPLFWVDAFAAGPFTGNPAAVCLLERPAPVEGMQSLAFELGLSETAFVWPRTEGIGLEGSGDDGDEEFALRWFTPLAEVELCGHATVAAAHALAQSGRLLGAHVTFSTKSGTLHASFLGEEVEIDLPAERAVPVEVPAALAARWPVVRAATGRFDLLVELVEEDAVRRVDPAAVELARLPYRGVAVTARGSAGRGSENRASEDRASEDRASEDRASEERASEDREFEDRGSEEREFEADYVLRFFAPRVGVPEDPVTGSAQCLLGPYWASVLGTDRLRAVQLSRRKGILGVTVDTSRVRITGRATTILRAEVVGDAARRLLRVP